MTFNKIFSVEMKLILLLLKKDDGIQRQESPGASASFHRLAAKVAIILQKTILNFFIFLSILSNLLRVDKTVIVGLFTMLMCCL